MKELVVDIEGVHKDHTVSIALKEELTISDDLEREAKQTPASFGYYAVLAAKAEAKFTRVEDAFEQWQAETETAILEDRGKPFKTVAELKRVLRALPKYASYKSKLNELSEQAAILKAVSKAFEHKKDLVQTIAANRRKEL